MAKVLRCSRCERDDIVVEREQRTATRLVDGEVLADGTIQLALHRNDGRLLLLRCQDCGFTEGAEYFLIDQLTPYQARVFASLKRVSKKLGWPTAYQNDLYVHDRSFCATLDEGEAVIFMVRELGTDTFRLAPESIPTFTIHVSAHPEARIFLCGESVATEMGPDLARHHMEVEPQRRAAFAALEGRPETSTAPR